MVKPLPAALRSKLHQQTINGMSLTDNDFDDIDSSDSLFVSSQNHRRTNENDDYAFLDEDLLKDEDDDDVKESLKLNYLRQAEPEYEQVWVVIAPCTLNILIFMWYVFSFDLFIIFFIRMN